MGSIKIVLPEYSNDEVSDLLRELTKKIYITHPELRGGGFLGGEFGYGADYENEYFAMKPFCWCEKETCGLCTETTPNLLIKDESASLIWYKYIGRSMEMTENVDWPALITKCIESVKPRSQGG